MSTEFLESKNERDDQKDKARKTGNPIDIIVAHINRNKHVALKRELHKNYYNTAIGSANGDTKKLLKILKRLLKSGHKTTQILSIDDKQSVQEIVDELNEFLTSIGSNLANKIGQSHVDFNFEPDPLQPKLVLQDTTVKNVKTLIMEISDAKATGDDGVPIRYIKMTIDTTAPLRFKHCQQ